MSHRQTHPSVSSSLEHAVDKYLAESMATDQIPGLSLAVSHAGSLLLSKGYGWANVELRVPATDETVYEIASITKLFTATAIMMLAEEGKVKLSDPVPLYRSGLRDEWQQITIRHLLTHTAGLPYWSVDWEDDALTADDLYRDVFETELVFAPGTQYQYNDKNFNLLGMIVHTVTGQPFERFLQERLFGPLGMTATQANHWRTIVPNRAAGYRREAGGLQNSLGVHWHPLTNIADDVPSNGANGWLLSTVADFAKFDAALYADAILPQAALQQMWTPGQLLDGSTNRFGLGWIVKQNATLHGGSIVVEHSGGNMAFSTNFCRYPDEQLSVAIFANLGNVDLREMSRDILALCRAKKGKAHVNRNRL